jgi:hypothetical protein
MIKEFKRVRRAKALGRVLSGAFIRTPFSTKGRKEHLSRKGDWMVWLCQ